MPNSCDTYYNELPNFVISLVDANADSYEFTIKPEGYLINITETGYNCEFGII